MLVSITGSATHIVGGGFDLQHLGNNTYEINLVVYRDCENGQAPFNDPLIIGIFDKRTHVRMQGIQMSKVSQDFINPTLAKCVTKVPGCTEKAVYTRIINLDPIIYNNDSGYYLSWERCCRNHIIQNIYRPENASMAFYAEIPSPARYINSTPRLITNPFTVLCLNNLFTYDIKFTDADNDSLVYNMTTPLNGTLDRFRSNGDNAMLNSGPYGTIRWLPEFGNDSAIKGDPPLGIDFSSGKITVNPSQTGVFVVAFRVNEYRQGVLIGFVNLELQFTVVDCLGNLPPVIKLFQGDNMITGNNLYVTIPENISFRVNVQDEDELDTVIIHSDLEREEAGNIAFSAAQTLKNRDYSWSWKTYCAADSNSPKKITITATDLGCPIPKTTQRTFYIYVLPMPVLPSTDILCIEFKDAHSSIIRFGDSARTKPYFKQYNLYRASTDTLYRLIKSSTNHLIDTWLDENTPDYDQINYRYFMKTENECGKEGASSDTLGTFDQLKYMPDKQYIYNVTVQDNRWVNIIWNQTKELDFARYFLYKGLRDKDPASFENISDFNNQKDTTYLDKEVYVQDTSYCYYVIMLDTCGNYGPTGEIFCTTVLTGKSHPFENRLEWQNFVRTDEQKIEYNLVKYPPYSSRQIEVGLFSHQYSVIDSDLNPDDGRYEYEIDVLHEPYGWNGLVERSRSNREPLLQKPIVYPPNAFTPNGDSYNDYWNVSDVFVKDFHAKVFNRWGQLVFETRNKNEKWDARDLNGNQVPDDVYVYLITYTGWEDEAHSVSGNVTVFR